jgi:hypothetical protein
MQLVHIRDLEADVHDAVAVLGVVGDERAVGADRTLDDELDRAGLQDEGLVVAVAVLRAGVGDEFHPPHCLVVVGCLGRIADDEDDRVPPGHREGILVGVVVDEADELLQLLEVEAGVALLVGELDVCGRRCLGHPATVTVGD